LVFPSIPRVSCICFLLRVYVGLINSREPIFLHSVTAISNLTFLLSPLLGCLQYTFCVLFLETLFPVVIQEILCVCSFCSFYYYFLSILCFTIETQTGLDTKLLYPAFSFNFGFRISLNYSTYIRNHRRLNPGMRNEKPASNHPNYDSALHSIRVCV
jgi:hypothetical protein